MSLPPIFHWPELCHMVPAGEPGKRSLAGSAWEEKGNSLVDSSQYLPLVEAISVPILH